MKKLKLNWIYGENFKGMRERKIEFKDVTNLVGANETGKTTVFDLWSYMVNDKDSSDSANFSIKNTKDTSLNDSDHIGFMSLSVDGVEHLFKKVYRQTYNRAKGELEAKRDGNETIWYHTIKSPSEVEEENNPISISKRAYMAIINEILDADAFKMLTNTTYFAKLHWQKKAELLFLLAGNPSNEDVAGDNDKFKSLVNDLKTKSIAQMKKDKAIKKKALEEAKVAIPAQIKELTRSLPDLIDEEGVKSKIVELEAKISAVDLAVKNRGEAYNIKNSDNVDRQNSINSLTSKINARKFEIQSDGQKKANNIALANQSLANNIALIEQNISSKKTLLKSTEDKVVKLESEKALKLAEYHTENKVELPEMPEGECKCPTCLQDLPAEGIEAKKEGFKVNFNTKKAAKLSVLIDEGGKLKKEIFEAQNLIIALKGQINVLSEDLLIAQNAELEGKKEVDPIDFDALYLKDAEIIKFNSDIKKLKDAIEELAPVDYADLSGEKSDLEAEISPLKQSLYDIAQRKKTALRIDELKAEEKTVAQQLVDIEGEEFLMDEFNRAKINLTEGKINTMFDHDVSFQMFERLENGNIVECCIFKYKGVPYEDVNTAGKVQMGLSVIKTLSKHYNTVAPIFLDNRESTTVIPDLDTQLVNLIVNPEVKTLTVEYPN